VKKQFERLINVYIVLILGVGLALFLLWALGCANAAPPAAQAASYTVCSAGCDFSTIQAAVDAARDGDVIKVAEGIYADVHAKPRNDFVATGVVTQVVYISKTVTIQGGYTTTNWATPYPITQPTILDARGRGRVIYIIGAVSPTIEGLHIVGGKALGSHDAYWPWGYGIGGGVSIVTATTTLSGCQIYSNTAEDAGGGVASYHSNVTLSLNPIQSNTVKSPYSLGGGVYLEGGSATLSGNSISNNAAGVGGGVFAFYADQAILSNNTIWNNTAYYSGGGVGFNGTAATLAHNTISGNTALMNEGGGAYFSHSHTQLNGNMILSNTAPYRGGGVYSAHGATFLCNNIIQGNAVTDSLWGQGAGLYFFYNNTTLAYNIIVHNTANATQAEGGGVYLEGGPDKVVLFSGNLISGNVATTRGGGLSLFNNIATLRNDVLIGNVAQSGSGMNLAFTDATLVNTIVSGNQANDGNGIYIKASTIRLLHATIAHIAGSAESGIYVTNYSYEDDTRPSIVALTNTIVASHTVGISVTGGNTVTVNGILWYGAPVTLSHATTATVNVQNQREGDPRFGMDGYHILTDSAAINGGVDAGVGGDIDNQPRPYQTPDLGADEYWPPGVLSYMYLPFAPKNVP
jgi:hypothetical protein